MEVVAELLKLGATVDAATKVQSPPHCHLLQLIQWLRRIILGSSTKHDCTVSVMCSYSMRTASVQPLSGFNIGSIFNDPCGEHRWK